MTISEKVAYLKGLAEGLNLDVEKSKEGKLISVMIGILEEVGLSIEDLEENALALGEEIDVLSDDLADVECVVLTRMSTTRTTSRWSAPTVRSPSSSTTRPWPPARSSAPTARPASPWICLTTGTRRRRTRTDRFHWKQ